jgi:hypothetical protein
MPEKTWLEKSYLSLHRFINQLKAESDTITSEDLRKRLRRSSGIYFGPHIGVNEIIETLERRGYIIRRNTNPITYRIIGCPE